MRPVSVCGVCVALALASACLAQEHEWEVGAGGGFGFMRNASINNPTGSVSAPLAPLMVTTPAATVTVTPAGMSITCFATLDIFGIPSA